MNTTCRFFVAEDGWFVTNQKLGKQDPFVVARARGSEYVTKALDELARQPGWSAKSHGGDVLSTLVGGLFNLKDVKWLCVNYNRFRYEVSNGADRNQLRTMAKMVLQITTRECLGLDCEEVDSVDKVFSDEDRGRLDG